MVPKPPKDRRGLRVVGDAEGAPKTDYAELTVSIPRALRTDVKVCSAEVGQTMAEFVAQALEAWIATCKRRRGK